MMSFLKLICGVGMPAAAAATLALFCQLAMADTTTLVCHDRTPNATTLELDEAKGVVTAHWSDWPGSPGKTEVLQATFGQNEIAFGTFRVNRLTGEFVNTETHWHWTCQVGKNQF
jgi:hypothetical protein